MKKRKKKTLSSGSTIVTQDFKMPAFTIFTYTIMHLVYRPKFCITIVSNFPWVPREIEDNSYAKLWGVNKEHYGLGENGE